MDSLSLTQEVIIRESIPNRSITTASINSRRNGSHSRRSNNRITAANDEEGEMTPLLQSDASSETSEDLQNYSTMQRKMINNNIDSPELPEIPEPPYSTPRYRHGGDPYARGMSRSRRNTVHSSGSESDCSIIEEERAISFGGALKIPGVLEFSLCLFFAKLVSYTFLYWLPTFILDTAHHVRYPNF